LVCISEQRSKSQPLNLVYLLSKHALTPFQRPGQISIEQDIFPHFVATGADLRGFDVGPVPFIDIGTPQSLQEADAFVRTNPCMFAAPPAPLA
jgi:NDP-sugar pyrophosphorylase family protein